MLSHASFILGSLIALVLLAGCGSGGQAESKADPAPEVRRVGGSEPAPIEESPAVPAGPVTPIQKTVTGPEVISVHTAAGDRINLEELTPWPVTAGSECHWKFSFKAAADKPLALGEHMGVNVVYPAEETGKGLELPAIPSQYHGGASGGELYWTPTRAGLFVVRAVVIRAQQEEAVIEFLVEATPDPAAKTG